MLLHTFDVLVKTFAGLFAQHTTGQPLRGDHAGAVTRFVVVLAVDRFHHRVRNVEPRQVHEFERAELEADLVFQDAVDRGEVGHTLTHDTQRLCAVGTPGVVHDETRCVLRLYGCVAHLPCIFGQARTHGGVCLEPGNDLNHLHQGHGVEEVITRKLCRALQSGRDGGDGQRRGVGHQHRVRAHDVFQLRKQALFDVQPLHSGFDHQVTVVQVPQTGSGLESGFVGIGRGGIDAAFVLKLVPLCGNGCMGLAAGFWIQVEQLNRAARLGRDLRNTAPHGTCANNTYGGITDSHILGSVVNICVSLCQNPRKDEVNRSQCNDANNGTGVDAGSHCLQQYGTEPGASAWARRAGAAPGGVF